ncbi:hypothetical protein [Thalassospira tepidiphila]|uniref:hypothetical protein n=1 Tax=Thalassospira tepidiphila TaxID=393657 RepID=UPI003AA9B574
MNAMKTTHRTYDFAYPFSLDGRVQSFLPGRYSIEIEEELSSGSEPLDFRRVKSRLYHTPNSGAPVEMEVIGIDPDDFDRAALQDGVRVLRDLHIEESVLRVSKFDRFAIERGENEGMSVTRREVEVAGESFD